MWGFRAVTNINELLSNYLILFSSGFVPSRQFLTNDRQPSPKSLIEWRTFEAIRGLKTLSSKWPLDPPIVTAILLPITWAHNIVRASHWVGLTFPGMMLDPGSFSGRMSSPSPLRGPLPKNLISFAIFINPTAMVFKVPWNSTMASLVAKLSNLLGAVVNLYPVYLDTSSAMASANPI